MPDFDLDAYKAKLTHAIAVQQVQIEDCNCPHDYTQFYRGQLAAFREALQLLNDSDKPGNKPEPATNPYPT